MKIKKASAMFMKFHGTQTQSFPSVSRGKKEKKFKLIQIIKSQAKVWKKVNRVKQLNILIRGRLKCVDSLTSSHEVEIQESKR